MSAAYETRLRRVLAYIHDNPAGDLSLDTLADVAAMSRFHWHRVFHGMTGETCAAAVRRIRVHRAACLLLQTDRSIAAIAKETGLESVQSFGRGFRVAYGMAPGAFRKRGDLVSPLHRKSEQEFTMYDVTIKTVPTQRLAAMPHTGAYLEIGKVFETISATFTARNLWRDARGMSGIYYDDPNAVPVAELRSQGGIVLADGAAMPEGFDEATTQGGKTAVLTFKGPYAGLKGAYDYLFGMWLPKSGEEAADAPVYENYLNAPADTAPDDLLTQICLPLR
jgi:AraC family transcriptional regulator